MSKKESLPDSTSLILLSTPALMKKDKPAGVNRIVSDVLTGEFFLLHSLRELARYKR